MSFIAPAHEPAERQPDVVPLSELCRRRRGRGRRAGRGLPGVQPAPPDGPRLHRRRASSRPVLRTFAGDPRAYRMRGTLIALRRDQAQQVLRCGPVSIRCCTTATRARCTPSSRAWASSSTRFDRVVALAGNPNTGKSTLFNALTGLKQHTGNWPGKTVTRAEGGFEFNKVRYKLVDLPGTYSLLSASHDEEIARDFLLFGRPDCTVVVVDATALERNLNLVLQVLEITDRVVVAVNLMDEARRKGIEVDMRSLSRDLGVPAVAHRRAHRRGHARAARGRGRRRRRAPIATKPLRVHGHAGVPARGRRAGAAHRSGGAGRAERALDRHPAARRRRAGRRGARERAAWPRSWPTSSAPVERFSRKIALQGAQ